jgi:uracil-DNA glycosylase
VNLIPEWKAHLDAEFELPYMVQLREFLKQEKAQRKVIYPPTTDVFNAFNQAPPSDVKVVILGQDPYHGPDQAHGLSFSVPDGVAIPPSLLNIYKELESDLGLPRPSHGNLAAWAAQGVFLLNATLTVEQGNAGAHQGKGWEGFTDKAISVINEQAENVVFMLWGAYAQKKGSIIDTQRHLVLKAPHPSPLSAHRGFLGCQHFSQANRYLQERGRLPIDWAL